MNNFDIINIVFGGKADTALENKDLELVMPLIDEWRSDLWVVTH